MELKYDVSEKLNDPTKTTRRKEIDVLGMRKQRIDTKYKTSFWYKKNQFELDLYIKNHKKQCSKT